MNSFFPDSEKVKINFVPYNYKPLFLFTNSIFRLKNIAGGENYIKVASESLVLLQNKYLSAKKISEQEFNCTRELCRTLSRSDTIETAKLLYSSLKYIKAETLIAESLESVILNNVFSSYGLLVETSDQWDYLHAILLSQGLEDFVEPVFRKEAREKYFNIPIITFIPASWIPELIILPPSNNFFLIYPNNFLIEKSSSVFFKAPDNTSIEISSEDFSFVKHTAILISTSKEFDAKFHEIEIDEKDDSFSSNFYPATETPFSHIEVRDKLGHIHYIESNKPYLTISNTGEISIFSFENEDQLYNIRYIVNNIDSSTWTSEDLKRAKNAIMEKWKSPLREHPNIEILAKDLEGRGAIKASAQNIKNWFNANNIAPGSVEDFKAVLSFAGITKASEVESFFELAKKYRGDSISEGHEKKIISQEIVLDFIRDIDSDELDSSYNVQGIEFSIINVSF